LNHNQKGLFSTRFPWYAHLDCMKITTTRLLILLFAGMTPMVGSKAQTQLDSITYTVSLQDDDLLGAIRQIEAATGIRIYANPGQLPDRAVDISMEDTTLPELIAQLLEGTNLIFQPYRDYALIIGPPDRLNAQYAASYFATLEEAVAVEPSEAERTLEIGSIEHIAPNGQATVTATLIDAESGLPITGANVYWSDLEQGFTTNENGQYTVQVPTGRYEVLISFVGYEVRLQQIQVFNDGPLEINLEPRAIELSEVTIQSDSPEDNLDRSQVGVTQVDMLTVKRLPSFMGETDVIKSLLLYPGVSTIGEGAIGFNVRGGEVDQNLILQDDAILFNPSHALGFFSTLNTDLIQRVQLFKATMPATYGGRLSSVLDVEMRDGSFEGFQFKGGVGPVTSRVSAEGPVIAGKSSFLVGFRSSYTDWLLRNIDVLTVQRSSAFFYDLNLRYTHRFNQNHQLILSGYSSDDAFTYNEEFGFDYQTLTGQAVYKTFFSDQAFNRLSLSYSRYSSEQTDFAGREAATLNNQISYTRIKNQFTYNPTGDLTIEGGLASILYQVDPGDLTPFGDTSLVVPRSVPQERALESALFGQVTYALSPAVEVSGGLRLVHYRYLGPGDVPNYENPEDPESEEITGISSFGSGETIATYNSLEPRLSVRYRLSPNTSLKAGYSRTAQFINQIFNSDSPTPGNQYQLSTAYLEPNRAHNASIGFFRNFAENEWETSVEVYGRTIDQLYDFKDFAELRANNNLETEVLNGTGRAYGVEVSVKRNIGEWNGFVNYTYSRTERQVGGINRGEWYPSNFDLPHNLAAVVNFQPNQRHTITLNFNYHRGRPVTAPVGTYETLEGLRVPLYSSRNGLRIPDYHRLDFAYTIGMGYRKDRRFKTSWTISVYNVYGRENPFTVFYDREITLPGRARQLAILGNAFPALTFNFEWK